MGRGTKQLLVGADREVQGLTIVLGAGERRGVVSQVCTGQFIGWELFRDLAPALRPGTRTRFGEGPQVPCAAVIAIHAPRAFGYIADHVGAAPFEPVRVGETHQSLGVVGRFGNVALQFGDGREGKIIHATKFIPLDNDRGRC